MWLSICHISGKDPGKCCQIVNYILLDLCIMHVPVIIGALSRFSDMTTHIPVTLYGKTPTLMNRETREKENYIQVTARLVGKKNIWGPEGQLQQSWLFMT